jgi:hypothetical protein
MNYLQSYTLVENAVEKKEEKLLWISTDQSEKVSAFLQKSFPEAVIFSLS